MKSRPPVRRVNWARIRDGYWEDVVDCLVEFHKLSRPDALARSAELRKKLDNPPPELMRDLYLNEEPFYIACDIAGTKLDLEPLYAQYALILQQHDW